MTAGSGEPCSYAIIENALNALPWSHPKPTPIHHDGHFDVSRVPPDECRIDVRAACCGVYYRPANLLLPVLDKSDAKGDATNTQGVNRNEFTEQ